MQSVRRVVIRCPVAAGTFAALARGEFAALEADSWASRLLGVIRQNPLLGDFGSYRSVFEVGLGIEGFTPTVRANPAAGEVGKNSLSPTVTITTYLSADAAPEAVRAALDALLAAHPWEVPVIELDNQPLQLLSRQGGMT